MPEPRRFRRRALPAYVLCAAFFNVTVAASLQGSPLLSQREGAAKAAPAGSLAGNMEPGSGKVPLRVLALGDSIAAGYGLPAVEALPSQLETALRRAGHAVRVINGGVSGDTTAGGLARLDWMLGEKPDVVIVELGGNDGLRGLDPKATYRNLDEILTRLDRAGVKVLLAGMLAPPNLGQEYGREFAAIYPALAERHHCPLYPFILDGVAARPELNQADGIHPNAQGVRVIVEQLAPYVERLLGG